MSGAKRTDMCLIGMEKLENGRCKYIQKYQVRVLGCLLQL